MTLQQFFDWVQMNPLLIVYYFVVIFAITILVAIYSKGEGHLAPWKQIYAVIIYMVCIPGIFAITLSIYFFLFEKRSIMETELLLQVLPIAMMFFTLYIIMKNVDLNFIPGFDKLSNLMLIIGILLSLMWVLDRTHLYVISIVPFYYVLILLIGGIFTMRMAFKKLLR